MYTTNSKIEMKLCCNDGHSDDAQLAAHNSRLDIGAADIGGRCVLDNNGSGTGRRNPQRRRPVNGNEYKRGGPTIANNGSDVGGDASTTMIAHAKDWYDFGCDNNWTFVFARNDAADRKMRLYGSTNESSYDYCPVIEFIIILSLLVPLEMSNLYLILTALALQA